MAGPRVLIVLSASAAWSRGVLRGFSEVARAQGWDLVHYYPGTSLAWLASFWRPNATVLSPEVGSDWPATLRSNVLVSVNSDRTAEGVPSVCLDEPQIGKVALEHLLSKGLPSVTTFRFDDGAFALARERGFREAARHSGVRLAAAWTGDFAASQTDPASIASWVQSLPKPCGVFACCDSWAQVVVRYARAAHLRVPEDVAVLGVDNDPTLCEVANPPLSSVTVPWQTLGREAAHLVQLGLTGAAARPGGVRPQHGHATAQRIVIEPGPVMTRRSSDAVAIEDDLVARAVRWIQEHSDGTLTVPTVARAVAASRRRLERRFQTVLGRTVVQEIRRVRVEVAKQLLSMTRHRLPLIAKLSGFSTAALLSVAFRREVGLPPGAYRRQVGDEPKDEE
jgi:LacI family transcriptional regulator